MSLKKRLQRSVFLLLACLAMLVCFGAFQTTTTYAATETRGIWLSYTDYSNLGLKDVSEKTYRTNIAKFLKDAKANGCNTVYFHVRAFDDAVWKSKTFRASSYISSNASSSKTAAKTYSYDPLKITVQECKKKKIKIYAWLNPYRIDFNRYLNPGSKYSTNRINRAIVELQKYSLSGIVFDDYFYHSDDKYLTPTSKSRYAVKVTGKSVSAPSNAKKLENVNAMVKSVYKKVHKKKSWKFGISPQGNVDNCMNSGCDVKTWMSKDGYIDFICPQIYWTDQYGSAGKTKMYSERLALWKKLNKKKKTMYIALALYRTGIDYTYDRGWTRSNKNMVKQIKQLRKAGCKGYVMFTASSIYKSTSKKELKNLKSFLK